MNKSTINAITLIVGENLSAVKVQFTPDGTEYRYLCAHDVEVGQQVVVAGYNDQLKVATVTAVASALSLDLDASYSYKFIMSTIDTTLHDSIVEARDELVQLVVEEQNKSRLDELRESLGLTRSIKLTKLLKKS